MSRAMEPIRRTEDDELLGFVRDDGDAWSALVVFGGTLADGLTRDEAETRVRSEGLAALAAPWWRESPDGWEPWLLLEASPDRVRAAPSEYGMPDHTRTAVLRGTDLAGLRRTPA